MVTRMNNNDNNQIYDFLRGSTRTVDPRSVPFFLDSQGSSPRLAESSHSDT